MFWTPIAADGPIRRAAPSTGCRWWVVMLSAGGVSVCVCLCGVVYYPRGDVSARHRQSKEASILWSHHSETRQLPGERDNARNNARCSGVARNVNWGGGLPSLAPSISSPLPVLTGSGDITPGIFFEIKGARRWVLEPGFFEQNFRISIK